MSKRKGRNDEINDNPKWWDELLIKTRIAHSFILHFNTMDYASPEAPTRLPSYLAKKLSQCEIVAVYSLSRGITFPLDSMKQKALEVLGLTNKEQASNTPTLDALRLVGAAPATDGQELPRFPSEALPLLDKLLRTPRPQGDGDAPPPMVAVIIERAELIVPDADLARMGLEDRTALATIVRWGADAEIEKAGNPIILIVGTLADLHKELRAARNKFEAIEVPVPDFDARRRYIERYMNERGQFVLDDGLTIEAVANATAGLSLVQVEDILLRAEGASVLTSNLIWDRKQSIIKAEFGDVLEIIDPRFGLDDIGGFEYIKEFFLRNVIRPIREGRKSRVPMGVLMTGPAGTGKSIMAEAVAKEAGVNAVRLRIGGQITSRWQGEGERNLGKALRAIASLAPTIVFIDEIDQAVKRGVDGGSNQQDQRIFQRLLEFMADTSHRGEIVFLAATNRPDLMDAALRRPGRFDKKVPFLISKRDERAAIFRVMARRYLGQVVEAPDEVLDSTEGWTGAEIEAVVVKAAEIVEDEDVEPTRALSQAVQRLSPSTADIQLMTLLAVAECNDRDLLPPKYREMLDDRAALADQVKAAREDEGQLGRRRVNL
jgi:ATP-dependent 26S proteasome regulatory subunit